jgi:hypothetical protein
MARWRDHRLRASFAPSRLAPSALVMKTAAAASLPGDELPAVMFQVIWDITTASPPDETRIPNLAERPGVSHTPVA